jgi:hypothetical protein
MLLSRTDEGNACNLAFYAPFSGADAPPALPEPPPESSDRDFANLCDPQTKTERLVDLHILEFTFSKLFLNTTYRVKKYVIPAGWLHS